MDHEEKLKRWRENYDRVEEYVRANLSSVKRDYGHKFIAFSDGRVLDSDENRFDLARRVSRDNSDEVPVITSINELVHPRIVEMSSPERVL